MLPPAIWLVAAAGALAGANSTRQVQDVIETIQNNRTALHDIIVSGWVGDTDVRGTADILWSCLLTLLACVYTALHLNIPPPGRTTFWRLFLIKVRWVAVALLAPEVVLYSAADQFFRARKLRSDLRAILAEKEAAGEDCRIRAEGMMSSPCVALLIVVAWRVAYGAGRIL